MKRAVLFFLSFMINVAAMQPERLSEIKQKINSGNLGNQKLLHTYIIEKHDMLAAQEYIQNGANFVSAVMCMVGGYSCLYNYGAPITAAIVIGGVVVKLLSNKHVEDCSLDSFPIATKLERNEPEFFKLLNGLSYKQLKDLKKELKIKRDQ